MNKELTNYVDFEQDCACPKLVQAKPIFESDCACPVPATANGGRVRLGTMVASNTLNGVEVKVYLS